MASNKKKKTRKKRKSKNYFGEQEELAVVEWLNAQTVEEKNYIFEKKLKDPLFKIVESVINTYRIHSDYIQHDVWLNNAFSFLYEKMHKFDPSQGTKAYSYYGTIVRRYAFNEKRKEAQLKKRKPSISCGDMYNTYGNNEKYSYYEKYFQNENDSIYNKTINEITELLKANEKNEIELTKGEIIMGKSILTIFENWDDILSINRMNNKNFEKKYILQMLREMTGFKTNEIRKNLKIFKIKYYKMKNKFLNE